MRAAGFLAGGRFFCACARGRSLTLNTASSGTLRVPLAGLILFLVWKDTKPRTAKAAGIGALVCVIAYVLLYVIAAVAGVGAAMFYAY